MTWVPVADKELCFLFSFHYFQQVDLVEYVGAMACRPTVFVDSGGFSAHTQGASVSIGDYAKWIRKNRSVIDVYANLDVIGDALQTRLNQRRMMSMGLRPLPVVHFGTDSDEVRRYADLGFDYQCLGGMVPHARGLAGAMLRGQSHPLLEWVDRCFDAADRCGVRFHGFGATTWNFVLKYPWRSVDSSSWTAGYRFGTVAVFEPAKGKWHPVKLRDRGSIMRARDLIQQYEVNVVSLVLDDNLARETIIALSSRSWIEAQRFLAGKTLLYLADADKPSAGRKVADATLAARATAPTLLHLVDATPAHNVMAAQSLASKE